MQATGAPQKLPFAWARNAPPGDILPTSLTSLIGIIDGRASLPDGFVPLNLKPVSAGGVPPYGGDHNGILNWLSLIAQWFQAGGAMPFDAAFSASIGGYPRGARVLSARGGFPVIWQSLVDNNTTNPDTAALGNAWVAYGDNLIYATTNVVLTTQHNEAMIVCNNALVLTLPPAATLVGVRHRIFNETGQIVTLQSQGGNIYGYGTGSNAVNLNSGSYAFDVQSDGANWILSALATIDSSNGLTVRGNVVAGGDVNVTGQVDASHIYSSADIQAAGNIGAGGTITANGNIYSLGSVNAAYLNSSGNVNAAGTFTGGNVNVTNEIQGAFGRMLNGAFGSGDGARVVTLSDYQAAPGPNGVWVRLPSGIIIQTGYNSATNANFQFPEAFPSGCFAFICGNADSQGSWVDNAFGYAIDRANYYCGTKESNQPSPGQISNFPVSWIAVGQ